MEGKLGSPVGEQKADRALRRTLLLLSMAIMTLGGAGAPLVTRVYFLHGGARLWLTSLLQSCAFPILLLPLSISHLRQRGRRGGLIFSVTGRAATACVGIGVLYSLDSFMYGYGSASLPASTSTLVMSAQLSFTAGFALLVVRQRFTAYSINAVVLLVMGPVVLGMQASGDRPEGVSHRRYFLGFATMVGAAALIGLTTPLMELTCLRMKLKKITYNVVMEMQVIIAMSAATVSAVAMLVNKDFQAIPREAKEFGLGERKYYLILVASSILWQFMGLGTMGVVSCSSSLLAGIVAAVLLPVGEVLPVFLLHEKFNGWKAVAMALCMWGFTSYLYGEYKHNKSRKQTELELKLPAAYEGVALE